MSDIQVKENEIKPPLMLDALIPIIVLVILLASAIFLYGADGTPDSKLILLPIIGTSSNMSMSLALSRYACGTPNRSMPDMPSRLVKGLLPR